MLAEIFAISLCVMLVAAEVPDRTITSLKHSMYRVKLTVVNGEPVVNASKVPYLVSIKEALASKGNIKLWGNICGATIISYDGKLLTAAHCFEGDNFLYLRRPYLLRAVAGSTTTDLQHTGEPGISKNGVQWRSIPKAILHPHFHFPHNDIAVAFVNGPWDYKNGNIKPLALPRFTTDWFGECYTAGYGRTGHAKMGQLSTTLLLAKTMTIPSKDCSTLWQMPMGSFICTSSRTSDVSQGDSGSPLCCDGQLAGLVCGKNFDKSTIYTRVSSYLDWIENDFKATSGKNMLTCSCLELVTIIGLYL